MKALLFLILAALLSGGASGQAPNPPGVHVKDTPGRFGSRNHDSRSEDKAIFSKTVQQTLSQLATAIDQVAIKVSVSTPVYFLTRVQALRQQHEHLRELTAEAIKTRMLGPRQAFETCVVSLVAAIEQADEEADALANLPNRDKREARR